MVAIALMQKSIYADLLMLNIYCPSQILTRIVNTSMNILILKIFLKAMKDIEMN